MRKFFFLFWGWHYFCYKSFVSFSQISLRLRPFPFCRHEKCSAASSGIHMQKWTSCGQQQMKKRKSCSCMACSARNQNGKIDRSGASEKTFLQYKIVTCFGLANRCSRYLSSFLLLAKSTETHWIFVFISHFLFAYLFCFSRLVFIHFEVSRRKKQGAEKDSHISM